MNKKKIVSKTILYIFIVLFIVIFKAIFGPEEALIGVMTITASLMFLEMNLTNNLIKNTAYIIGIELLSGVAAFLAVLSPWLGIPINFIIVFILGYSFCYTLKKPMYTPLALQYLFMLSTPIPLSILPKRLLALFFGGIIIMIIQIIANRGKEGKKERAILSDALKLLKEKINTLEKGENSREITKAINLKVKEVNRVLEDANSNSNYLINKRRIILSIAIAVKKLNEKLTHINCNMEALRDLSIILDLSREILDSKEEYYITLKNLDDLIDKYKTNNTSQKETKRLIYSTAYLRDRIIEFKEMKDKDREKGVSYSFIDEEHLEDNEESTVKSIRMSYGLRLALGITIAAFFTDYLEIVEGRWMMYTVLALIVPIFETATQKLKDRLFATFIGACIAVIVFEIFKSPQSRMMILLLTGYINGFITRYKYSTIGVTISSIGSALLSSGTPGILSIQRIVFVLLGAFLAFLINKYFFSYNLEDETRELQNMANMTLKQMVNEVYKLIKGKKNKSELVNYITTLSIIEEKLSQNDFVSEDTRSIKYTTEVRELESLIYDLYMWIDLKGIVKENMEYIDEDLNSILHFQNKDFEEKIKIFQEQLINMNSIEDEISVLLMEDIMKGLHTLRNLKYVREI